MPTYQLSSTDSDIAGGADFNKDLDSNISTTTVESENSVSNDLAALAKIKSTTEIKSKKKIRSKKK